MVVLRAARQIVKQLAWHLLVQISLLYLDKYKYVDCVREVLLHLDQLIFVTEDV